MAKKSSEASNGKKIDIFKTLQKVDNSVEIISQSVYSNIEDWIPSGNYILNACLSGDIFKGAPSGRILTLAGESQTGKSFLAISFCREAQKKGYTPVYLDSENAIDKDFVTRLGCDPNNFIIKQVNTIKEATTFIANMCQDIQEQVDNGAEKPKILLVLDSVGQLTSEKEKEDALEGKNVADFTKAKDIRAMFRVNTIPIAKLQIPWICTNHMIACLSGDTKIIMKDGTKKEIKNVIPGDEVKTLEGFDTVQNTMQYHTDKLFMLEFDDGEVIKCTENHKFLVKKENGNKEYVKAKDLKENDKIVSIS